MSTLLKSLSAALLALMLGSPVSAAVIANSSLEYSNVQGQDAWSYGFFNLTAKGSAYAPGDFTRFDTFDVLRQSWIPSAAQVGATNIEFLNTNQLGGHPNGIGPGAQNSVIWAMRRYTSEVNGTVAIDFDLHKLNTINPQGGGITGHIFVDGVEVFNGIIANADGVGVQATVLRSVHIGSLIDFAIDPRGLVPLQGNDGLDSARADGTIFTAVLRDGIVLPEPPTALLVALPLLLGALKRRAL